MPAPHPAEFRQRAVELARTGDKPVAALAKNLGISESCLRNWMAQADADNGGQADRLTTGEKKKLAELRPRNRQLEMETRSSEGPDPHRRDRQQEPPVASVTALDQPMPQPSAQGAPSEASGRITPVLP
jgi:transposase